MERLSILQSHLCSEKAKKDVDPLLKEWRGNCLKLILNRPRQYNSINESMLLGLLPAIEEANTSSKVLILKSTLPGKVFCAGGDVKEIGQLVTNMIQDGISLYLRVMLEMANAKPVTIAFWDGIVMGGGAGLSTNCNIKIATEKTAYAMPEAKLGYFTDVGASYFLSRFKKNIGLFLAMTANSLKGKEAYQAGVADYFVLSKNLPALEADIERISLVTTVNEALIKEIIEKYAENIPRTFSGEDIINEIFCGKNVTEVIEKLKLKSQENEMVKKWYGDILKCCPRSHFYVFELLKRGKNLSLQEALSMENYLASKIYLPDYHEGIRTVLYEKGAKPNWSLTIDDLWTLKTEDYFPEPLKVIDYLSFKPKQQI